MNPEQLNSARLARWSQNGEARLTLEAAAEWLSTIGFCPYLPIGATGGSPAASFLEAVVGRPAQTPSAGERSRANELLVRMIEDSAGVPLKLGNSLGEQPDFVASAEALRYIYALRGNRNFKTGPSTVGNDKVTPLALHCWEAIQEQGPLDIPALQPILGRDMTEAAIARALQELWVGMYVFPILSVSGKPAKWEILSRRFPQQVAAGAGTGHAESQSAMVSLYLHAVVAAAEEEVLAFLSPLAPQSKLREVIHGLGSMRQLDIIDIGGRAHVCLQGGLLPEMVAQLSEDQLGVSSEARPATVGLFEGGIEIEREPQRAQGDAGEGRKFVPKQFVPRKFVPGESAAAESAGKRFAARASSGSAGGKGRFLGSRSSGGRYDGAAPSRPRSFAASAGGAPAYKNQTSENRSSGKRDFAAGGSEGSSTYSRKPSVRGLGERAKRWEKTEEGVAGRSFGDRTSERKPSFDRKPPFKSSGFKPAGFKSTGSGPAKPWASKGPRSGGDGAEPWAKRASFTPGAPRERDSEERPQRWAKPGEGRSPAGFKKPYAAKSSGFKSSGFKPAISKPWASKTGGGAPKRWDKSRASSESRPEGARPDFPARPAGQKSRGAKPGGRKPSGFTSSGFKSAGSRSAEDRAPGSKPWVSKGAESRVGSAKSYAARTSRTSDGTALDPASRGSRKPYGKTGAPAPWKKRADSERPNTGRSASDKPKRREKPDGAAGVNPGEKRAAKPFWAKNPRGGKGSVAGSRTNRPRGGKKTGGKSRGKKK